MALGSKELEEFKLMLALIMGRLQAISDDLAAGHTDLKKEELESLEEQLTSLKAGSEKAIGHLNFKIIKVELTEMRSGLRNLIKTAIKESVAPALKPAEPTDESIEQTPPMRYPAVPFASSSMWGSRDSRNYPSGLQSQSRLSHDFAGSRWMVPARPFNGILDDE